MNYRANVPDTLGYDVVVCGGGPAGTASALASARSGMETLLLEAQGALGGVGTTGLVPMWLGGRQSDGHWVVGGIFREMTVEAVGLGFAKAPVAREGVKYTPHGVYRGLLSGVVFDPFAMAHYLDRKLREAGVDVLLATSFVDVEVDSGRVSRVIAFNKSGLMSIPAAAVIDATGDADVAFRAGCPVTKGRDEDGLMTPVTLAFIVDGVDMDVYLAYVEEHDSPRFREEIQCLHEAGKWPFDYDIFIPIELDRPGSTLINTSRITGVDGTDGRSVSDAFARGREETFKLLDIMRGHIPGFSGAKLQAIASSLGVRETRRISAARRLTVADLVEGRTFEDAIGYSSYGWDLPDPRKPSNQPMHAVKRAKPLTVIPYGVMVPVGVDNLICPGRAVSVERDVLGPLRVMAPAMAMGEAAGLAAEQVVKSGFSFAEVETGALRDALRECGALVDEEAVYA